MTLRDATSLPYQMTELDSCGSPTHHTFLKFLTKGADAMFAKTGHDHYKSTVSRSILAWQFFILN